MKQTVQRKINEGYHFDLGRYFSEGWQLFADNALPFMGFMLLYGTISVIISIIPFVSLIGSLVISPCLAVGIFIVADKIKRNEAYSFSNFFDGFQYLGQFVLQIILTGLLAFAIIIAFGIVAAITYFALKGQDDISPSAIIAMIILGTLAVLLMIYLGISYLYANQFIVFGKMEAWEAMESSRKVVGKNFFSVFAMTFIFSLISFAVVGLILLAIFGIGKLPSFSDINPVRDNAAFTAFALKIGIGMTIIGVVLAPIMQCVVHSSFRDIMEMDKDHETDTLNHFIEK